MAYAAWSVSFGEQPSTAKWNILGTNDASFNNGTGIANMALSTTSISNPYKFSAYRSAAYSTVSSTYTALPFDAEYFDSNSNFDSTTNKGRYTVPVNGFYYFNANYQVSNPAGYVYSKFYKNGAVISIGQSNYYSTAQSVGSSATALLQLTAGDYIEYYYYVDGVKTMDVATGSTRFSGFLVSHT